MERFYRWTRDLHLYFGLFISPFVLLFAVSVFFLNHAKVDTRPAERPQTVPDIQIPDGIDTARGVEAVERARAILLQLGLTGEVGFTRFLARERHFIFPVSRPGMQATVDVDLETRAAAISRRNISTWETMAHLHRSPGPHNAAIRGNWIWTRVWRLFADATIYLVMFISVSGIYLWFALKAERRVGLTLLTLGAVCFFCLVYAVIR